MLFTSHPQQWLDIFWHGTVSQGIHQQFALHMLEVVDQDMLQVLRQLMTQLLDQIIQEPCDGDFLLALAFVLLHQHLCLQFHSL